MAYRSHTASPAGSQSPSSSSSANASPYIHTTPLDNMVPTDDHDSSYSAHGTPNHSTTSLPRTLNSGKGGCWTCRVRRKKCDEQREGDSCRTCKRLTIKCLGWGAKRPDWMRDKKNVDAYKASIKAQLSRAGLIRGQPRHNPMQVPPQRAMQQIRPPTLNGHSSSVNPNRSSFEPFHHSVEPAFPQNHNTNHDAVAGLPTSAFDDIARSFDPFDPATSFYPQTSLFNPSLGPESLNTHEFLHTASPNDALFPDTSVVPQYHIPAGQIAVHEELVMHYFNNVQKVQSFFAGEAHSLGDRSGTTRRCHPSYLRLGGFAFKTNESISGVRSPQPEPREFLDDGRWSDNDAIAALHLVSLSQLSGGASDWDAPFNILCQWLLQIGLHNAENPWMAFLNQSLTVQHYVKATLWLDVFSSLSALRPPKFLPLWQSLLGEQNNFWNGSELELPHKLRMDVLTGCPDEAMLAIAEVSALAQWKASQIRNNCLSYPDLIRRGTAIEQQLRRYQDQPLSTDAPQTRVHGTADATQPTEEERSLIANIFLETANLYLHTVLSNSAPEIHASVQVIVRLFTQLPPSEVDRTLVFPICLAGSMTNDSTIRDFFKGRIRALNESYGNLLQTRRLMEAVWQKRDGEGKEVDLRETIREHGLKLLLI